MTKQEIREEVIGEIEKEAKFLEKFLLEHLESDSGDFSGYFGGGINEDTFHITFNNINRKLGELRDNLGEEKDEQD